jgi:hypothetical protein
VWTRDEEVLVNEGQVWRLEIKNCSIMEDAPGQVLRGRGRKEGEMLQLVGFPYWTLVGMEVLLKANLH